jgi:hypothetical protein
VLCKTVKQTGDISFLFLFTSKKGRDMIMMKRFSGILLGLPLAALGVGVLSLIQDSQGQTPSNPPVSRPASTTGSPSLPPGFVPAGSPATPTDRPAPRQLGPFEIKGAVPGGPWMVLAATYMGPHADFMAEQVVRQLQTVRRASWKGVYTLNFADLRRRQEEEEFDRMVRNNPQMPYRRRVTRIEQQCGVLAGGYPTQEKANEAMRFIKQLPAPKVYLPNGEKAEDIIREEGEGTDRQTGKTRTATLGTWRANPFSRAFVIHNPTVPRQKVDPTTKVDPAWKNLNAAEDYSLLKCRKAWTLVIKFYEGPGILQNEAVKSDNGFLAKFGFGTDSRKILHASAMQAHELAKVLRQLKTPDGKKLEAFVLHMRNGSLVTVGGFDSLGDDNLKRMQFHLSKLRLSAGQGPAPAVPAGSTGELERRNLDLFAQPMPMRVPKP